MKLSNAEVFGLVPALRKLAGKELPVSTSWRVLRNLKMLAPELETINSVRNDLIKKYGTEKDGSFSISPDSPNMKPFLTEISELMGAEVEIKVETFILPDAANGSPFEIEAASLEALEKIIEGVQP